MEPFDFEVEMRRVARATEEASRLVEVSQRDMDGLDELNVAGRDALLAWRSASTSASRHLHRYLDHIKHE